MRVKLDENLPSSAGSVLTAKGYDVETVYGEGLTGVPDARLAEVVRLEDLMLVTLDRGFADIRAYPPGSHPGIIVLRLPNQQPSMVDGALRALVSEYDFADLRGCVVVVQPNLVRVRRPGG